MSLFNEITRLAFHVDTVDLEQLEKLFKIVKKAERRLIYLKKKEDIKHLLTTDFKNATGRGYPAVFFICSKHNKCADDHEEYQGKIYVDRFWRSKLILHGTPEWLLQATEKFVRKNQIKSIQEISGRPVYLGTRNNCRHFFTVVDLLSALTLSEEVLVPEIRVRARKENLEKFYKEIKKVLSM